MEWKEDDDVHETNGEQAAAAATTTGDLNKMSGNNSRPCQSPSLTSIINESMVRLRPVLLLAGLVRVEGISV